MIDRACRMAQEDEIAHLRRVVQAMDLPPPQELRKPPAEALAALRQDAESLIFNHAVADRRQAHRRAEDMVRVRR